MSTLRVTGLKQETSTATNISLAVGGGVTVAGISTFYNNTIFTNDVTVTGNISVGGTLTYQDVTDVDSIGIITARNGIHVSGGNVGVNTTTFPVNGTNLKVSDGTISRLALDKTGANARQFEIGNFGTGLNIYDLTADAERVRITSDGDILLGLSTKRTNTFNAAVGPKYQIEEVGSNDASIGIFDCSSDTGGGRLLLAHQRSGAVGGNTVLNDNDFTGMITFQGNDGTHFVESAAITAEIDGTPGTDDMPGALVLKTTNVGAAFATEKLRISSSGEVTKPGNPSFHVTRFGTGVELDQTGYDGRDGVADRIEFNGAEYDIGSNVSLSGTNIGLFTAPVAGLYLFIASASISSGANFGQSWFVVNGSRIRGNDWVQASGSVAMNTALISLSANDTVGFHPYNNATGNTISGSRYHTWMKGCLIG